MYGDAHSKAFDGRMGDAEPFFTDLNCIRESDLLAIVTNGKH